MVTSNRASLVIACGLLTSSCNLLHSGYVNLTWPAEFEEVEVRDCKLHMRVEGSGPWEVVFIHGNPGRMQDFEFVFDVLDKRRYRTLVFDRPLHGHSTAPKPQEPAEQVALLHELLQAKGFKRPLLVGHSWGGGLAQLYAHRYPADVSGLVLIGAEAVPDEDLQDAGAGFYDYWWSGWFMRWFTSPVAALFVAPSDLTDAFHPADLERIEGYDDSAAAWFFTRPSEIVASVREEKWMFRDLGLLWKSHDALPTAPAAKPWTGRGIEPWKVLATENTWTSPDPRWLNTPILVMSGAEDCVVNSNVHSAVLAMRHPRAVHISLPGESHMLPIAQPELVARAIEACWTWIEKPTLADVNEFKLFDCKQHELRRETWKEALLRYLRNRFNDTLDMLPVSFAKGWGLYAGARCTAFAGTALGHVGGTTRAGWPKREGAPDLRAGTWEEAGAVGLLLSWRRQSDERPKDVGNLFFVWPAVLEGEERDWLHSLDVEGEVHLAAVGARIAISPFEIGDWLLGWFTIDPRDDDAEVDLGCD